MIKSMTIEDGCLTGAFSGRLSGDECNEIEQALSKEMKAKPTSVVFDVSDIDYVASSFLRICLKTAKQVGVDAFRIKGAQPLIKKIFMISKLETLLDEG